MEKQIYKALAAAALEYFPTLEMVEAGTYTAAELVKHPSVAPFRNTLDYYRAEMEKLRKIEDYTERERDRARIIQRREDYITEFGGKVTISVNSFTCTLPKCMLFAKLADWEREFKIKAADRVKFVKEEEFNASFSCIVEFPKAAKYLKDYVSKEMIRPVMTGIYLDVAASRLTASDTHVLTALPVNISDTQGAIKYDANGFIFADPAALSSCAGLTCKVELSDDAKKVRITKPSGDTITMETVKGNYVNYARVFPKVHKDGYFQLSKESIKSLTAFCKSITRKYKGDQCITLEITSGATTGKVYYKNLANNEERTAEITLATALAVDVCFGLNAVGFLIISKNWDGGIWFSDPSRPLVFDNIGADTVAMPMAANTAGRWSAPQCAPVPAFDRRNIPTEESEEEIYNQVATAELEKYAVSIYLDRERQAEKEADEAAANINPAPLFSLLDLFSALLTALNSLSVELTAQRIATVLNALSEPLQTLSTVLTMLAKWLEIETLAASLPTVETPKEATAQAAAPATAQTDDKPPVVVSVPVPGPGSAPVSLLVTPRRRGITPPPRQAAPRIVVDNSPVAPPGCHDTPRPPPSFIPYSLIP